MPLTARIRRVAFALALPALFLVLAALVRLEDAQTHLSDVPAALEGHVVEGGTVPGGAGTAPRFRYWSTWNGSDDHLSRLELGPFPAPPRFSIFVRGYPGIGDNSLTLENTSTGESLVLSTNANPGEAWAALDVAVPAAWHGAPLRLIAVDRAAEWGGWMAISDPFVRPWWAAWWTGILPRLVLFLMEGTVVVLVATAARVWVSHGIPSGDSRTTIAACGVVGALAYAVFWLHFADATLGRVSTWAVLLAALVTLLRSALRNRDAAADRLRPACDAWAPAALALVIGLAFFAALHLHQVEPTIARLAATRLGSLPADNEIPQIFADRLLRGLSPKSLVGDWLSSDRPPLQTGWQLVFARPLLSLGMDSDNAMQGAGIWFQLVWVPGAWAWLRRMEQPPGRSAAILLAVTPCTFLFLNTVFIWPKLGAAGFLLGAFTCWIPFIGRSRPAHGEFAVGGILAGLAWVAHGGVAFALLPLAVLLLVRLRRTGIRPMVGAAAAFAVIALPWTAYQRFYESPGNRLLKWHLAGQIAVDDQGTLEALRHAYVTTPAGRLVETRRENTATVFRGEWRGLVTFTAQDIDGRRAADSGFTFFSLGWWNAGWLALAALFGRRGWRQRLGTAEAQGLLLGTAWALATTAVWVALMFIPGSTLLHQGSYTTPIIMLVVTAVAIARIHTGLFLAVAMAQVVGFAKFSLPSCPASSPLPWRSDSTTLLIAATVAALVLAAACRRCAVPPGRPEPAARPGGDRTAHV